MEKILSKLYNHQSLSVKESQFVFDMIIKDQLDSITLSSFLTALKMKGEHQNEIVGAAIALKNDALDFPLIHYPVTDIVGTGGDNANTFNISTTSAIVASSCNIKIAKHGNKNVSSMSGSTNLLESLGIKIDNKPEQAKLFLDKLGICFLHAPYYHKGIKYAAPVRKALRTRTIFNILGPLINPANPRFTLIGVYDQSLLKPISQSLVQLGVQNAAVIFGSGLDEFAVHDKTKVIEIYNNEMKYYELSPVDFGLTKYKSSELKGGNPNENAQITTNILNGEGSCAQNAVIAMTVSYVMKLNGQKNIKHNTEFVLEHLRLGKAAQKIHDIQELQKEITL